MGVGGGGVGEACGCGPFEGSGPDLAECPVFVLFDLVVNAADATVNALTTQVLDADTPGFACCYAAEGWIRHSGWRISAWPRSSAMSSSAAARRRRPETSAVEYR